MAAYPFWSKPDADENWAWVNLTLSVVPSLLGFAVGGMAIMLAFSSGKFLEAIRQKGKNNSYFMKVISAFFHFTLVLVLAIVVALIGKAFPNIYISALGFFTTIYGVLLAVATIDHLWQTAMIFNKARDQGDNENNS